jgi:hypothetical protein
MTPPAAVAKVALPAATGRQAFVMGELGCAHDGSDGRINFHVSLALMLCVVLVIDVLSCFAGFTALHRGGS